MPKTIDLSGQVFGRLTVLNRSEKKDGEREAYWDCLCECGKKIRTRGSLLRKGKTKSCGCMAIEQTSKRSLIDIKGMKFGRLTVIDRCQNKDNGVYWNCICDCGNEIVVNSYSLRHGYTQSCGCLQKERTSECSIIDMTGKKIGKLTVIDQAASKNGKAYWNCVCDCGTKVTVAGAYLRNGHTQSCGCLNSSAEMEISQILQDIGIKYEVQKTYKGLNGFGGGALRFDFYLPEYNVLIEYQGKQHYSSYYRFGGEEEYQKRIFNDEIKRKYCKKNNIDLIEIPYWKRSSLEKILTEIKER